MMDDVEPECCDLLEKNGSDNGDKESVSLLSFRQESQALVNTQSMHSTINDFTKAYLSLKNVQYSRPPSKDICSLAVSTFEKMDLSSLRSLEKLNNILKAHGKISIEELKVFTMKIMTEVWRCDEKLETLMTSDPILTETLGRELLVLFDNVMSDPVYEVTKSGKPQRYTRACLDNTIQPMYDDNVPQNKWSTYETVISTYTSPTAFTPEMESLIRTATQLGISTNDLNLKKFVTERSLSAFLKTLIQAKLKKNAFIKKFNSKLMGVLHHAPNIDDTGTSKKFKYSFSKLYQFIEPKTDTKSSPDFHSAPIRRYSARGSRSKFSLQHNGGLFANERIGDFTVQRHYNDKRTEHADTICNRCHETNSEKYSRSRGLIKSMSDSCLSLSTCKSISCCQCFDTARRVWDKRYSSISRPALLSDSTKLSEIKTRSNLKHSLQPVKEFKKSLNDEERGFGLLTEQRSFFRFGEGALRDAITEYVEAKNANYVGETNKKAVTKKKRVRWVDETSFSSVYGSLMDSESEFVMLGSRSSSRNTVNHMTPVEKLLCFLLQEPSDDSQIVAVSEKPMKRVFLQALTQATLIALFIWVCFLLYLQTPEVAKKLRRLSLGPWLDLLKKNLIV